MRRQHPFISLFGLILTALLLAGLGVVLWRTGGLAFSPGRLSAKIRENVSLQGFASHASFEGECRLCHQPLQSSQGVLCMECHDSIRRQIDLSAGTHSTIPNVEKCFLCHADHRGTTFDPTRAAYASYDHARTRFSLVRHQVNYDTAPMSCLSCHQEDPEFAISEAACADCHASHDQAFMAQHRVDYGEDCTACHDGQDHMADFNHQETAFPLEGAHAGQPCTDCHKLDAGRSPGKALASFTGAPTSCEQCHAQANPHPGMFSSECAACHAAQSWWPARLDGAAFVHSFSLALHQTQFDGSPLTCRDCHLGEAEDFEQVDCAGCHSQGEERAAFMAVHLQDYGEDCTACHDGSDRMQGFAHERTFPLEGRHAEIECAECHTGEDGSTIYAERPRECVQCHEEPSIHAGFFGVQCQLCHTSQAWAPALLKQHSFPLDHGEEGEQKCSVCHPSRYNEYTCYNCHEHEAGETAEEHREEGIPLAELAACAKCHPTGREEE